MARKKKSKPDTIYNIGTANLEIDYQKLAEAIVKANHDAKQQKGQAEQNEVQAKQSFLKLVWEIWTNKKDTKGQFTTAAFSIVSSMFFKVIAILGLCAALVIFVISLWAGISSIALFSVNPKDAFLVLAFFLSGCAAAFLGFLTATVFWGVSHEIDREQDKSYVLAVFSSVVTFLTLLVTWIALLRR